jgi:hypothetical protein
LRGAPTGAPQCRVIPRIGCPADDIADIATEILTGIAGIVTEILTGIAGIAEGVTATE